MVKNPLAILGYLNFSNGEPNADFPRQLNQSAFEFGSEWTPGNVRQWLETELAQARQSAGGFSDTSQAAHVIRLVFDECLPAYRRHHADLLFHLDEADFFQPFFLACVVEATLRQGPPWTDTARIILGTLDHLNDFLGFRPLAVLENGRQMEPYPHERFRPMPLYFREAGVAFGRSHDLIARTIQFFQDTPLEIQQEAHFDWTRVQELAVDLRAHDHLHPVNKRTNYMFGEWDPHRIDSKGYFDRFIIRKIILDALLQWIQESRRLHQRLPQDEILFDAAAVLCGTMLMASWISGSGPGTHPSSVSLTSLLSKVAHQRDAFYARLLQEARGARKKRLLREAELTQQPFGHVRQRLNIELAGYGAKQVQTRHLAQLFARMGYPEASRRQARVIPSAAARFECEIHWRLTNARLETQQGHVATALDRIREIEDLLHRGIDCGALIDPWNVLGFQGQFPLFSSREDSLHDIRAVDLIETMERLFGVYSQALGEAAARGNHPLREELSGRFEELAEWWDKYATTTVADLPQVSGADSVQSARHVAQALSEWQQAGAEAGDISFWKQHVEHFQSAKAYALVVDALLERGDQVASMALLVQWLNQAEFVGLDSGPHSIFSRLTKWMKLLTRAGADNQPLPVTDEELGRTISRLFAYLEANAGEFWEVPSLGKAVGYSPTTKEEGHSHAADGDDLDNEDGDEEDELFAAAYDDVTYRDSANDGQQSDTASEGPSGDETSFEIITRYLEPRLQFLETLAELWQAAAAVLAPRLASFPNRPRAPRLPADYHHHVENWLEHARHLQRQLRELRKTVWERPISRPSGDHDSNVEYDEQLQTKFYLLHTIISTDVSCETAQRALQSCLPKRGANPPASASGQDAAKAEEAIVEITRGVLTRNNALVSRRLPELIAYLMGQPLLYVPLNNDGEPEPVRAAQSLQALIRFLLTQLPRLGLLHETWTLLQTAYDMERKSRPGGQAVTEFDQLFRTALRNSLECVIRSSKHWRTSRGLPRLAGARLRRLSSRRQLRLGSRRRLSPRLERSRRTQGPKPKRKFSRSSSAASSPLTPIARSRQARRRNTLLIEMVSEVVRRYSGLWVKHSRSTRLSTVENLADNALWKEVKQFIQDYGSELFHARMLTLGNLRAMLHNGMDRFLDYLEEHDDPLHPLPLLEDIEDGVIDPDQVMEYLELIYGSVVDRIDRFVEYNTTTTQSDYGERFYCFLDFLRVEAAYERDAWNLIPFNVVHEELSLRGRHEAALLWESVFRSKNKARASRHVNRLKRLEKEHGMRLPALTDRIEERFVKPFAVNRMLALVPQSLDDANRGHADSPTFATLEREIEEYLKTVTGSGIDVAPWLRVLEKEVDLADPQSEKTAPQRDSTLFRPAVALSLRTMQRQLRTWEQETRKKRTRS